MQLTAEERLAVEAGKPLRCSIAGTSLTCVILRDDVFDKLQRPLEVVENKVLDDLYSDMIADSPHDWKAPDEWAAGENPS